MADREKTLARSLGLLALMIGIMLLMIACSQEHAPITGPALAESHGDPSFRYPELTPDLLIGGPVPGFQFFNIAQHAASTLDDPPPCDSVSESRWCDRGHDKTVKIDHLVEIKIRRGNMPFDTTITVVAPRACWAVADCYPHPFQFEGTIEIKWKVHELDLPDDFDYESLVPWYVDDEGNYVPVEYEWRGNHRELVVRTNHFSRYIIGQRLN